MAAITVTSATYIINTLSSSILLLFLGVEVFLLCDVVQSIQSKPQGCLKLITRPVRQI